MARAHVFLLDLKWPLPCTNRFEHVVWPCFDVSGENCSVRCGRVYCSKTHFDGGRACIEADLEKERAQIERADPIAFEVLINEYWQHIAKLLTQAGGPYYDAGDV
jgi:hypothetical protein